MINRVLIRMKTVQLLYSYLLVEKPFSLESQPSAPTKEKRFAYQLYLDLINLMDRLAHQVVGKNKKYPLANSRFILKVENDDRFKALQAKSSNQEYPFKKIEDILSETIKDSLLFHEYQENKKESDFEDRFWENVFNAIIIVNPRVNQIIREIPGYTLAGVERMKIMMETTFSNFYASRDNIADALRTLQTSLMKARDLYMRLLALPVELTKLRLQQLETNRRKFLATVEDLNPNMKLVHNKIPNAIEKNEDFEKYIDENHLSWKDEDPELLDLLLKAVLESEKYQEYIASSENDLQTDGDFWIDILADIIFNNQHFLEYLENKSVFWNDDLEIIGSFVLKTLKRFEHPEKEHNAVMPMYKDGSNGKDSRFGAELFGYVMKNKELYRHYINEVLIEEKWDADRLAFMDVVIIMTAMAEIINYPEIPLPVSVNEYIEIAKDYSSPKSGQFINGLLASLIKKLKEDKIILK